MPVPALRQGVPCQSAIVSWVDGAAYWDGFVQSMYAIDGAYAAGKRGTLDGAKLCASALRWGNFVQRALLETEGPYSIIEAEIRKGVGHKVGHV
jgi:hypothetical protein